jgi:hypothetical protein
LKEEDVNKILKDYSFFSRSLNEQILRACFHDLNNLICGISMFTELIEIRFKDDKCQKIIKTAWKSQEIIKALQNYTFCYDIYRPYDVNPCIETFFTIIKHVKEFNITKYILRLSPNLPQVTGNRFLFQQTLCALSSYFPQSDEILVSSELKNDNFVVVTIYPGKWKHDIEEFRKSEDYKFCNEIAHLHQGHFAISSKEATFTFSACI